MRRLATRRARYGSLRHTGRPLSLGPSFRGHSLSVQSPPASSPSPLGPTAPPALTPRRELWLLLTLAGIQFTHILDFMIMMPLGPQFTRLFAISDAQFGLLVSAYTLSAGASGLLASTYIDRFGRKRLLLTLYVLFGLATLCLLYTSPSPRDRQKSRMPSSA